MGSSAPQLAQVLWERDAPKVLQPPSKNWGGEGALRLQAALSSKRAPVTRLANTFAAVAPANPDDFADHPMAKRLDTHRRAVDPSQLLDRQRRPDIFVALMDDREAGLAEGRAVSTVAGLATALGDNGVRAVGTEGAEQPANLAALQTHQRSSVLNARPAVRQINHHAQRRSSKRLIAITVISRHPRREAKRNDCGISTGEGGNNSSVSYSGLSA